jgi:hypothetical protein
MTWHSGAVLHSSAPYLIFWTPTGENIPASSQALLARYLKDVAADSGKSNDVFGVLRQYYDAAGFADYRQTFNPARQVIVDRHPYPPRKDSCSNVSVAFPTCVTDLQIEAEISRLIAADGLLTDGPGTSVELPAHAPIYFVLLPADVNQCQVTLFGPICGDQVGGPCAYHNSFYNRSGAQVLFSPILTLCHTTNLGIGGLKDYQLDGKAVLQEPNGVPADPLLTPLSHELAEATTDPSVDSAWFANDKQGFEIGDVCSARGLTPPLNPNAYAPILGGSEAAGTLYDQLINGHRYYTQSQWSDGSGTCEMRPSAGKIAPRFTASRGSRTRLTFDPTTSTSTHPLSSATWNFGDHSKTAFRYAAATLTPVKHSYRRGRYTVSLTLVDNRGNLKTTTRTIDIK